MQLGKQVDATWKILSESLTLMLSFCNWIHIIYSYVSTFINFKIRGEARFNYFFRLMKLIFDQDLFNSLWLGFDPKNIRIGSVWWRRLLFALFWKYDIKINLKLFEFYGVGQHIISNTAILKVDSRGPFQDIASSKEQPCDCTVPHRVHAQFPAKWKSLRENLMHDDEDI